MKYVKILGLAAVAAMALMAFVGAGTASASVLCTSATSPCPSDYAKGTEVVATSSHTQLTAGFGTVTCKKNEVAGKTKTTGGASETVFGPVESLVFEECNGVVKVLKEGELEVHATASGNGTLTSKGASVTVELVGVHCVYGTAATGTELGAVTGGATATVDINAKVLKQEGGFLCASTATWEGTYTVTSPKPLFVTAS
jgi:hypothetical protein